VRPRYFRQKQLRPAPSIIFVNETTHHRRSMPQFKWSALIRFLIIGISIWDAIMGRFVRRLWLEWRLTQMGPFSPGGDGHFGGAYAVLLMCIKGRVCGGFSLPALHR